MTRPGWRDPRLWVGVVLVAGSVVLGARVLASADDTVRVWAAASDLPAGTLVADADLTPTSVRFTQPESLAGYLRVEDPISADLRLGQPVAAGDLVPVSVLGDARGAGLAEVPVAVDPEQVPGSVGVGSVVDLYVVSSLDTPDAGVRSGPILTEVSVLDAPALDAGFGTTGRRQLVLAVPDDEVDDFFAILGSLDNPVLTVVRRE
jgi:hypothetical protein